MLAEMGRQGKHSANMYRNYDQYQAMAARGDQRAKDMLGRMNLTYAAMELGPDALVAALKKNIGIID